METALKKVKGLGTANNGVGHWWLQRLTAIALIPLILWFVITLLSIISANQPVIILLTKKLSIVIFVILLIVSLLHSTLGVKVIIEDYIHNKKLKFFLLIFINLLAWVTGVFLAFSLINLYIISLAG